MKPRMKLQTLSRFTALGLGCCALMIAAQAAPGAKQTFQSFYTRMDKADAAKDADTIWSFYAPNYAFIDDKGEPQGLATLRKNMDTINARYKTVHTKTTVQSVKITHEGAMVVSHVSSVLVRDSDTPGQEVKITVDETDRDFWIKTAGGWKLKQGRVLAVNKAKDIGAAP